MLNRLIKFRFPSGEKVDYVLSKTTLRIKADAVSPADQKKWADKSFAWIYGSEMVHSDPLIPKAIWGFNGSEHLHGALLIKVQIN